MKVLLGGSLGLYTEISIDDLDLVKAFYFSPSRSKTSERPTPKYYARCGPYAKCGNTRYLHRLILQRVIGRDLKTSEQVDHINGDSLDNRRENLRLVSNKENSRNSSKPNKKCSSKYKGVTFDKRKKNWRAYITVDYKNIHLGYFQSEDLAAIAYNRSATKYFGRDFARLNDV